MTQTTLPLETRQNDGAMGPAAYTHEDAKIITDIIEHQARRGWTQLGLMFADSESIYWMDRRGSAVARHLFVVGTVIPADFRWSLLRPSAKAG